MQELKINSQTMSFNLQIKDNKPNYYITIRYPDCNVFINQDDNDRPQVTIYYKRIARKKYLGLDKKIKVYAKREVYTNYVNDELDRVNLNLDYVVNSVNYSQEMKNAYTNKAKVIYGCVESKVVFTFDDDYDITATRLIEAKKAFARAFKNFLDTLKVLSKTEFKVYQSLEMRNLGKKRKLLNIPYNLRRLGDDLPF